MTTKEKLIKVVQNLPDDASIEEVMERLLLVAKVEKGLQQADKGQTVSHNDIKEKMSNRF